MLEADINALIAAGASADCHAARAVFAALRDALSAGTVRTGLDAWYDLVRGEVIKPTVERPLVVPEGAVVVPGARAVTIGKGPEWGLSLSTPVIVKYRDSRTDTRTELEAWIR